MKKALTVLLLFLSMQLYASNIVTTGTVAYAGGVMEFSVSDRGRTVIKFNNNRVVPLGFDNIMSFNTLLKTTLNLSTVSEESEYNYRRVVGRVATDRRRHTIWVNFTAAKEDVIDITFEDNSNQILPFNVRMTPEQIKILRETLNKSKIEYDRMQGILQKFKAVE